jgi:hypothetical protein
MQTYWVHSLNIAGTETARDEKLFDCFEDDTKTPPPGMIYSDVRGPIPIMILV